MSKTFVNIRKFLYPRVLNILPRPSRSLVNLQTTRPYQKLLSIKYEIIELLNSILIRGSNATQLSTKIDTSICKHYIKIEKWDIMKDFTKCFGNYLIHIVCRLWTCKSHTVLTLKVLGNLHKSVCLNKRVFLL